MTALLLIAALINLLLMVSWILGRARTVTPSSNSSQWSVVSIQQRPKAADRRLAPFFVFPDYWPLTTGYCSIKPKPVTETWYWVFPEGDGKPVATYRHRHLADRHLAICYPIHGGAIIPAPITYEQHASAQPEEAPPCQTPAPQPSPKLTRLQRMKRSLRTLSTRLSRAVFGFGL